MRTFHNLLSKNLVAPVDSHEVTPCHVIQASTYESLHVEIAMCLPSKPLVFERRKVFWMFCLLVQGFAFIPFPLCDLSHSDLRHSGHTFSTVGDGLCILGTAMALVHSTFSKPSFSPLLVCMDLTVGVLATDERLIGVVVEHGSTK
jgi:hypothetical protein